MESKGEDITKDIEKMKIPNLHKLLGRQKLAGMFVLRESLEIAKSSGKQSIDASRERLETYKLVRIVGGEVLKDSFGFG